MATHQPSTLNIALHKGSIYCRVIGLHNILWLLFLLWQLCVTCYYHPPYLVGSTLIYKININFCENLNACFNVHLSPANWWCLHCSPWSPAWWISSCTPSLEPKGGSSHIAVVWRTYHTAHCSTSQRIVLRGQRQKTYLRNAFSLGEVGQGHCQTCLMPSLKIRWPK